jgi:hypothetical protein
MEKCKKGRHIRIEHLIDLKHAISPCIIQVYEIKRKTGFTSSNKSKLKICASKTLLAEACQEIQGLKIDHSAEALLKLEDEDKDISWGKNHKKR